LLLLLLLLLLLSSWPNESCETAGRRDGLAFLHASFSQLFHIFFWPKPGKKRERKIKQAIGQILAYKFGL
jgi:hypothetical protein